MCKLKQKIDKWTDWLRGDDVHSIKNQITSSIWDTAFFRCINEARKHSPTDNEGNPLLNGEVHGLINRGFWAVQSIKIRRLTDNSKGVISLRRLIDDIEKNREIITRQNLLEAHGFPYDYETEQQNMLQKRMQSQQNGPHYSNDGALEWLHSKHIHESMDALANVDNTDRQPSDIIECQIFNFLIERLDKCDEIRKHVNNFVAHSATPETRQKKRL